MKRIVPSEYTSRIARCKDAMQRSNLDCVVLFPGPNFTYFTGLRLPRERYRITVALLGSEGSLALMGPSFEEVRLADSPVDAEVHLWTDEDDQHELIARWIRARYGARPRVGLELTTDYYHYLGLKEVIPGAAFIDPTAATDELRAIKSSAEIACLRAAALRTRVRMERVLSLLVQGMTERELTRLYGPGAMVQFGPTASLPYAVAADRTLRDRDVVVIDAGDWVEGYRSDLARTFFFGEPFEKMREVYRVVNDAELAAIDAARPGEPAGVIDRAARKVIEKAGLIEYYLHRAGHGIGLAFHEIPICAVSSDDVLKPGMVLAVEPGIYIPNEFGVRIEDDILITDKGCELLADRGPLYLD
ncbi:MAG: aminopeptidase P family protein [Deltaproteobacteria bacterium]|nr:aminopeptidase P family protein [Deltaproteobacteria bacterium]